MTSTAVFYRDGPPDVFFRNLAACSSATIISESTLDLSVGLERAVVQKLTLKELLDLHPVCAYRVDSSDSCDQFIIKNQQLIIKLTPESDFRFGLVTNTKMLVKGHYTYDLQTPFNKRVLWALENTITDKYDFFVFATGSSSRIKPTAKSVRIAVPPLEYFVSKKRSRPEDEVSASDAPDTSDSINATSDTDLDLLGFDDWSNEFIEWAGLAALNPQLLAEHNGGIDSAICNYFQPQDAVMKNVALSHFKGPFLASQAQAIWNSVRSTTNWVVLILDGVPQLINRPQCNKHTKSKVGNYDRNGGILISNPPKSSYFDFWGY